MPHRFLIRLSFLALPLLLLACQREKVTRPAEVDAEGRPVIRTLVDTSKNMRLLADGIDVSHHQGDIDWVKVRAAGKVFAFAKATEGIDYIDPMFATHWPAIREAKISRGAYHFFRPEDDPIAQAKLFIENVELEPGDLAPVLDVELADGQSIETIDAGVRIWIDTIKAHYGVQPILYSNKNFVEREMASGFEDSPLWIADFNEMPPESIGTWSKWTFWQSTEKGEVDGIEALVDLSKFRGSAQEWSAMVVRPKAPPSGTEPTSPLEHRPDQPAAQEQPADQ